jgi:hypothetical protein
MPPFTKELLSDTRISNAIAWAITFAIASLISYLAWAHLKLDGVFTRQAVQETKIDNVIPKLDRMEDKLDKLDGKLDALKEKIK